MVAAQNGLDLALLALKRLVNVPADAPLALTTRLGSEDATMPVLTSDTLGVPERASVRAAEATARDFGRTLLVLDAVTGGDAARLYERLGWVRVGDVPDFALYPDGGFCSTTYYYRRL